jgi:hypothetical protein
MHIKTFNLAESTGDAQEKQARSYELAFAENKKLVNSKIWSSSFFHFKGLSSITT